MSIKKELSGISGQLFLSTNISPAIDRPGLRRKVFSDEPAK